MIIHANVQQWATGFKHRTGANTGKQITFLIGLILAVLSNFMSNAVEITGLNGSVTALSYSPDGKTLAATDGGFDLSLWNSATGQPVLKLTGLASGTSRVCWSPDGKTIYGTTGNEIIAWDTSNGSEKLRIKGAMTRTSPKIIALSMDGRTLAAAGWGLVKFWNAADGQAQGEEEVHANYGINWLAFSSDGRFLVTSGADRTAQLTETAKIVPGATFKCANRVNAAEFSPDGKTLFVADQGAILHQFDVATGQDTPAPALPREAVRITVSPDGKWVACSGSSLQIWSRTDNRWYAKRIEDSAVGATSVAFSPDGKTLACGDAEGRIHTWPINELISPK